MKLHRKAIWNKAIDSVQFLDLRIRWPLLSLKRLDSSLWLRTPRLIKIRDSLDKATNSDHDLLQETIGDAFFWALGAYEIIRTLDQRCRSKHAGTALEAHFRDTKHFLERVRVPLAKLEPSRRHGVSDFSYARAVLARGKGYAWGVSNGTNILFTEASDRVVSTLTDYRLRAGPP